MANRILEPPRELSVDICQCHYRRQSHERELESATLHVVRGDLEQIRASTCHLESWKGGDEFRPDCSPVGKVTLEA